MNDRYKMEYVNSEVSVIIDTEDNHELTAEELTDRLNYLTNRNKELQQDHIEWYSQYTELLDKYEQLKQQLQREHQMLDNAILLERTRMGRNSLKQYKEAIQ